MIFWFVSGGYNRLKQTKNSLIAPDRIFDYIHYMKQKGINYDVGTFTTKDSSSREEFDHTVVEREIGIIKNDLHCTAIRISGQDIDRLLFATQCALKQGLEVWFSPALINATPAETLDYFRECARAVEPLRARNANVVFVTGTELTFFMKDLVQGDTPADRMQTFMKPWRLIKSTLQRGSFGNNLDRFLGNAVRTVRYEFKGKLSYASGAWENVDWSPFDLVGADYYRDAYTRKNYIKRLHQYTLTGKPVVITEFGCCTYAGAEEKGGYGWAIVDRSQNPPLLKGKYMRSEETQAKLIGDSLAIFEAEKVAGAFVFTFVMPKYPYHADPQLDLDMASYGIVKSYADRLGFTYPDLPWEPKQAFTALAAIYGQ
jgi:hypothetical protein